MNPQSQRLAGGGRIDRSTELEFTVDKRRYAGHPGDTLASALLANGVRLVGQFAHLTDEFEYLVGAGDHVTGQRPHVPVGVAARHHHEVGPRDLAADVQDGHVQGLQLLEGRDGQVAQGFSFVQGTVLSLG